MKGYTFKMHVTILPSVFLKISNFFIHQTNVVSKQAYKYINTLQVQKYL